jgi:hypothetical protein
MIAARMRGQNPSAHCLPIEWKPRESGATKEASGNVRGPPGKNKVHDPIAGRWLATTVGLSILSSAKNLELDKEPTVVKAGL